MSPWTEDETKAFEDGKLRRSGGTYYLWAKVKLVGMGTIDVQCSVLLSLNKGMS